MKKDMKKIALLLATIAGVGMSAGCNDEKDNKPIASEVVVSPAVLPEQNQEPDMMDIHQAIEEKFALLADSLSKATGKSVDENIKAVLDMAEKKGYNEYDEAMPFPSMVTILALEEEARQFFPKYDEMMVEAQINIWQTQILSDLSKFPKMVRSINENTMDGYLIAADQCGIKGYPQLSSERVRRFGVAAGEFERQKVIQQTAKLNKRTTTFALNAKANSRK